MLDCAVQVYMVGAQVAYTQGHLASRALQSALVALQRADANPAAEQGRYRATVRAEVRRSCWLHSVRAPSLYLP